MSRTAVNLEVVPRAAYLFPGQGAQTPDAGPLVADRAPDLLALAVDLIGEDPIPRCGESTRFAQPAIVLSSLAAWRGLDGADAVAFAGHSLGELGALAAAGAMSEEDAVRLAVLRGDLMAQAGESTGDGTMLAVLKGTIEVARELAGAHGLTVANDNAPGQVVLAGGREGIEAARKAAREHGVRAMELDVAGAFHSPFMAPAREPFAAALAEVDLQPPRVPVISGLTAAPFSDIAAELADAVVSPVRWREVMLALHASGVERYVDVGPGEVLDRLVSRNLEGVGGGVAA